MGIVKEDREESTVELKASAYIPASYIADEVTKLQMYKRIAAIHTRDDEEEIIDDSEGENTASTKDEVIQLPEKYIYGLEFYKAHYIFTTIIIA